MFNKQAAAFVLFSELREKNKFRTLKYLVENHHLALSDGPIIHRKSVS
jgi:hypothetical protein